MQEVVLGVSGMSCNHCKAAVTRALSGLSGVQSVDIDLASGRVKVQYDGAQVTVAALKGAITEAGYDVNP